MTEQIGFIGLGAMGLGMCRNLMAAGFQVVGYDINLDALAALEAAGGVVADTPAAAAAHCELLAVCVFDAGQAEQVLFGDGGAASTLPPGVVVAMHTTMAPQQVKGLAERLAAGGHTLVDAPITGGKAGADDGTLSIIAGGPAAALDQCNPAFEAMGKKIYRVGDTAGSAAGVKMINQLLVGVHMVATGEAMALAVKAGADPQTVYDVITHGGGNSNAFKSRAAFMIANDFTPRGALEIFVKDLGIVEAAAGALEFPVPLASAALTQFRAAVEAGYGRDDAAAIVKVYEQAADVKVAAGGDAKDE